MYLPKRPILSAFRTTFSHQRRAVIPFDAELPSFNLVAVTSRLLPHTTQFTLRIDQIAVHRRTALLTATLGAQGAGFGVIAFQHVHRTSFSGTVLMVVLQRLLHAYPEHLKENPRTGSTNSHLP